jgi:ABC-type dipeptide/oligopeptide/nickel transport system ATPase component
MRRHHVHENGLQKAIKAVAGRAWHQRCSERLEICDRTRPGAKARRTDRTQAGLFFDARS